MQVGRVLLDMMKQNIRAHGLEWDAPLHHVVDMLFEGIQLPAGGIGAACMEAMIWPLRHAAQGIDAMRASYDPSWGEHLPR